MNFAKYVTSKYFKFFLAAKISTSTEFRPFDENLHAKYGHACGHGACKKCMKNEFSRQKEGFISMNLIV